MPDYSAQLPPADRWAVAAYIRALQLSQNAKPSDVPSGTQVQSLPDIAQQEGLPASFAGPWALPGTAVSAKPTGAPVAGAPEESPNPPSSNRPEQKTPTMPSTKAPASN
jgi:hypothetical protein